MSQSPVVSLKNMGAGYGKRTILREINLEVHRGEFVGLIGANGAGKTTLLRSLLGLVPGATGEIRLLGGTPTAARTRIGYVPQKHQFQWDFPITVQDAVMTGRSAHLGLFKRPGKNDWMAVFSAIKRAGIEHLSERIIGELSGGQRQRVLLARALASDPQLLLLDEPFTGVDAPTQDMLNTLYRELAAEGLTIVMSTHDMLAAREACTRLIGVRETLALDAPAHKYSVEELHHWLMGRDTSPHSTGSDRSSRPQEAAA